MSRATFDRSATFAWSPSVLGDPLLATGTVAGALDESFSSESKLELWDPFPTSQNDASANTDFFQSQGPAIRGTVQAPSRFSRLSWGYVHEPDRPQGVLASGLESGELAIWDPVEVLASNNDKAIIWTNKQHAGPVRGLDFNKGQPHVLATGATNGEIWVWDLNTPQKPYSPGTRSRNLADITSLAWNHQVSHILASSSTSGYTVVWDLKGRREVVALNYAAPQAMNPGQGWMGGPQQARAGLSAVSWHPENATKLATASEDDLNPVVMIWDLRNPRAPEKILTGHEKGILSMNWCPQDPDLLVSCGKDSRTILWNPNSGDSVGELSRTTNWTFESSWCPRLPDLLAVGSFDGKIDVHSLQATRSPSETQAEAPSGADIFEQGNLNVQSFPAVSLKQAPKWTKRPIPATFGFGGKIVSVNAAHGPSVKVHHVVTEPDVVERAVKLDYVLEHQGLADFAKERSTAADLPSTSSSGAVQENETWALLQTLFNTDNRDELVQLLGFSKEEVKAKVDEAITRFKNSGSSPRLPRSTSGLSNSSQAGDDESGSVAREPLVTFAEEPSEHEQLGNASEGEAAAASTIQAPSESGASTGAPESTKTLGEGTEITEPSLFGDDAPGQQQAAADFYSNIRSGRPAAIPDHLYASGEREQSSVAATMGSRASSVTSIDQLRGTNTFKIYPSDESETDRLLTRALILGDFQSAVALCLAADRFADALLLSTRGGPELLASTQKAYFERHTASTPYLRLFPSVASNDLGDIVQNADLADWQEVFVVLCTFAKKDEFSNFVESLGQRIEFAAVQARASNIEEALKLRKNALLCYLAAQRLERVIGIFLEEMKEEEAADEAPKSSAHAKALQTLVEKVAVFKAATAYVDTDLTTPTSSKTIAASGARIYKLSGLYDRYLEYAELLSSQGLSTLALNYVAQVPADYQTAEHDDTTAHVRERLLANAGKSTKAAALPKPAPKAAPAAAVPRSSGYMPAPASGPPGYKPPASPALANPFSAYGSAPPQQPPSVPAAPTPAQNPYGASAPPQNPYGAPAPVPNQHPYAPAAKPATPQPNPYASAPQPVQNPYAPASQPAQNPYAPPPSSNAYMPSAPGPSSGPPPPPPVSSTIKRPDQGWNDAPKMPSAPPPKRAPSAGPPRSALTSPFPGAAQPSMPPPPPMAGQSYGMRPPSAASNVGPPPPPAMNMGPPPPRGGSMSPAQSMQPPSRMGMPPGPPPPVTSTPMNGMPPSMPPPPMSNAGPYAPPQPPIAGMPPSAPSPYLPAAQPAQPPPMMGMGTPQSNMAPPKPAASVPAPKPEPPKPKYPAGDRSHIPAEDRIIFDTLLSKLQLIRENIPPTQKKMVDDTERRLNVLFDALNCETLSKDTVDQLHQIVQAIQGGDAGYALELHLQLLTSGPSSDNLTAWMPAVKVIARTA